MADPRDDMAALLAQQTAKGVRKNTQRRALAGQELQDQDIDQAVSLAPGRVEADENAARLASELTGVAPAVRALSHARDFVYKPSVASATAAGTNAAMAAFKPVVAAKILAGGYGTAMASDLLGSSTANAMDPKEAEQILLRMTPVDRRKTQEALGLTPDGLVGRGTVDAYVRREASKTAEAKAATELKRVEIEALAKAKGDADAAAKRAQIEADAALTRERDKKISAAKNQLLADIGGTVTKKSSSTQDVWNKTEGMTALAAAILGGGAARAASSRIGFTKMVGDAAPTWQKSAAKIADDYVLPGAAGMELGYNVAMAPLAAQANRSDRTNPEYAAWQRYRMALPEGAKSDIDYADARIKNIPQIDPSITDAIARIDSGKPQSEARIAGFLGGLAGNVVAAGLPTLGRGAKTAINETAELAGGLPASIMRGHHENAAKSAAAASKASQAQQVSASSRASAAAAERDAILSQQQLAEAQRRSGVPSGGQASAASEGLIHAGQTRPAQAQQGQQPGSSTDLVPYNQGQMSTGNVANQAPQVTVDMSALGKPMSELADIFRAGQASQQSTMDKIVEALASNSSRKGGIAPTGRGREGQIDPYNTPIQGPRGVASPADVARQIFLDASKGGQPTSGRGGNLTKSGYPEMINAELRRATGNDGAKGLAVQGMQNRRGDAEALIADIAKSQGIPFAEAARRYFANNPLKDASGGRLNVPTLAAPLMAGGTAAYSARDQIAAILSDAQQREAF